MTLAGPDGQPLDLTGTLTADAAPPEPEPPFACPMPGDDVLTVAGAPRVHLPKSRNGRRPWTEAA